MKKYFRCWQILQSQAAALSPSQARDCSSHLCIPQSPLGAPLLQHHREQLSSFSQTALKSALRCLNHLGRVGGVKPESGCKSNSPGSNACDARGHCNSGPRLRPKAIPEHHRGREHTLPNLLPADTVNSQAQQLLIVTLRSSTEGNETEGHFPKPGQVSQRELQWGKPALKKIHSILTAESSPNRFGF